MMRFGLSVSRALKGIGKLAGICTIAAGFSSAAHATYVTVGAIALPNGAAITSFDIGFVDPALGTYYLADRSTQSVVAVNTSTNQVIGLFGQGLFTGNLPKGQGGPNGVVSTGTNDEIYVGDGDGTVKVLNALNGSLIANIPPPVAGTNTRADENCWDGGANLVMMAWDVAGYVGFINTKTHTVVKVIQMDGKPGDGPLATNGIEQCKYDARTDLFYLNIPEVNGAGDDTSPGAVVVINPHTLNIVAVWSIPINLCAGPAGMATGPRNEIALGCQFTGSVIINEDNGAVVTALPNWGGDEIYYEAGGAHYAFTGSNHIPPQNFFVRALDNTVDQTMNTVKGLHSIAADFQHRQIYFPVTNAAAVQSAKLCSPWGVSDKLGCILVMQNQ